MRVPETYEASPSKAYVVHRSRDLALAFDGEWVVSEAFTVGDRTTRVDVYVTTTRKYVVICTRSEPEREPLITGDAFEDFGAVVDWLGRDNRNRGLGHAGTAAVTAAVEKLPWLAGANQQRV
jgi:hypothetical protein